MKKIIFVTIGIVIIACNSSQKTVLDTTANSDTYAETITDVELKEHLYIYASDEFKGRETGTEGQKKAVNYIKAEYENLGVPAAKSDGNYFQKVPLEIIKLPAGSIFVNGKEYNLGEDFVSLTPIKENYSEIVYVGYGIEEGDYSDYKGLDVKGKVVLIKSGEPKNTDSTYTLSGNLEISSWSNTSDEIGKKVRLAIEKGAVGIFYYDTKSFSNYENFFNKMKSSTREQMVLKNKEENINFEAYINSSIANAILPDIATNETPQVLSITITGKLMSVNQQIDTENVAAFIKGSEKPNEYVVISSHLDHIGVNDNGQINNGADDDGSGTVALLEIAEAFKKAVDAGNGPKRSIVFLHVTGEEKGLLGSQYYTDIEPIFPLKQTVANLNIDMIGRIDPIHKENRNYIYLIGSDKLSTDLHELSEEVNKKYMNIELDYTYNDENDPNRFYYRSDHYNFAKNNIPIIFYFNGTHADYHKPGDTPDKINYDLLQNRSRLVFHTAWEVANRDERVVVDKASK